MCRGGEPESRRPVVGNDAGHRPMLIVYTIGHSNHTADWLVHLLRSHEIVLLADVRSSPFSRHNPQFNAHPLRDDMRAAGIQYTGMHELGGKPDSPELLQRDGTPDYDRIEASHRFIAGLARLMDLAAAQRVAILCAEADPMECHRERLVATALRRRGVEVRHILADGSLAPPPAQGALDF